MTRRNKRTEADPYKLSDEAEVMLSRHSELTRIDPVFRRFKHQDVSILDELHKAGIFRAFRRNFNEPIMLSELGTERARDIRRSRLAIDPQGPEHQS